MKYASYMQLPTHAGNSACVDHLGFYPSTTPFTNLPASQDSIAKFHKILCVGDIPSPCPLIGEIDVWNIPQHPLLAYIVPRGEKRRG
jgi:hypothetical protein